MPVNRQQSDSSDMDSDVSPSCGLSDLSRGDSLGSRSSSSRSRSLTLDDESLKYLTHEEKDVILFFEETIDSLEDDFEEQVECDSGLHCHSPGTLEESASGTSEPGDVIDLVQPAPPKAEEPECLPAATETADTDRRQPSTACTYIHAPSPAAQPKASSHLSPSSESPVPPAPAGAGPVAKEDTSDVVVECRKPEAGGPPSPGSAAPEAPPVLPARPVATAATSPRKELLAPPAEHPKLPRSVPTPLVIAQKMSEKLAGSEALAPPSPSKESKPGDWRTLPSGAPRNGDPGLWPRPTAQPAPKIHRFPSNISVTNSAGKEFNKTISKAAVNVQERKAQVLANINGVSFLSPGATGAEPTELGRSSSPEPGPRGPSKPMGPAQEAASTRAGLQPGTQQSRGVQTEHCLPLANGFQSIHDMLRSEPSTLVSTGKTVTFRADPALATKLARQDASKSFYEPWQPGCGQDARKRSGSLPRAVGFRPQGITVQFSGRGSTEEARREALRKLGLLKENS